MIKVHPYQADINCNYSRMSCRAFIQIQLSVDGVYTSIDTHMLEKHILIIHLVTLDNGRNPDIGTLNKYRGDIFFYCCAESFK